MAQAVADQPGLAGDPVAGQHVIAVVSPLLEVVLGRNHRPPGGFGVARRLRQHRPLRAGLDRNGARPAALGAGHHPQPPLAVPVARRVQQGRFLQAQAEGVLEAQHPGHGGIVLRDRGDLFQGVDPGRRPGVIAIGGVLAAVALRLLQIGRAGSQHALLADPAAEQLQVGKALLERRGRQPRRLPAPHQRGHVLGLEMTHVGQRVAHLVQLPDHPGVKLRAVGDRGVAHHLASVRAAAQMPLQQRVERGKGPAALARRTRRFRSRAGFRRRRALALVPIRSHRALDHRLV